MSASLFAVSTNPNQYSTIPGPNLKIARSMVYCLHKRWSPVHIASQILVNVVVILLIAKQGLELGSGLGVVVTGMVDDAKLGLGKGSN